MSQIDPLERIAQAAEAGERRARRNDLFMGVAGLVALAFFALIGYAIWTFQQDQKRDQTSLDQAAAAASAAVDSSSGKRP